MKIDGREIARGILDKLKNEVSDLKKGGVTPTLAVILVGNDPASLSYIAQKKKAGEEIGARVSIQYLASSIQQDELRHIIKNLNDDSSVHGIIIQRPLPKEANIDTLVLHSTEVWTKSLVEQWCTF